MAIDVVAAARVEPEAAEDVTSRIVGASRSGRDAPKGAPRKEVWMTDPTLTTLLLLLLVVLAIKR